MMKVVDLYGGPGSGKSTLAASAFVYLKGKDVKTELVGEAAKELVYQGRPLDNQVLLAGLQYARLKDLERHGCEIAISDSPLDQQLVYASLNGVPYYLELQHLVHKLTLEFEPVRVWVKRTKPFSGFGRIQQDLAAAKEIDGEIAEFFSTEQDMHCVTGDASGQQALNKLLDTIVPSKS